MEISNDLLQNKIWTAVPDRKSAFVLNEFDKYTINLTDNQGFDENIEIHSGIGSKLVKEEWRGDEIVGTGRKITQQKFCMGIIYVH